MEVIGTNGQIRVLHDSIIISRRGWAAALKHANRGDKSIPFSSITAIQLKMPDWMTTGYIQVTIQGGSEAVGGVFQATSDENTVLFNKATAQNFVELREQLEDAIRMARPARNGGHGLVADELAKLADLRDRGIITSAEFDAQKARLLG